jgi:hypothetical protein
MVMGGFLSDLPIGCTGRSGNEDRKPEGAKKFQRRENCGMSFPVAEPLATLFGREAKADGSLWRGETA